MESKVITVQITFDKHELGHLRYMLHDATTRWHEHWMKASNDDSYHLSKDGCAAVLKECQEMYNQISDLYNETFD